MKKFINSLEQLQEKNKLSKIHLYLAAFGILLFLALALTLPTHLYKQQILKSNAQVLQDPPAPPATLPPPPSETTPTSTSTPPPLSPTTTPVPPPTNTPVPTPTNTPTPLPTATPPPTFTPTPTRMPTPVPTGNGLTGSYFSNRTLSGSSALTRIDPAINFLWATASPHPSLPANNFSVRWTGYIVPQYSQQYTFYTQSDDGVRLWVNGVRIINNWTDHASTENSGKITLTAGVKYPIRLEYYERQGQALIQLRWQSPSQPKQIIPQSSLFTN